MQELNFYIEYKIGETKRNEKLETLFQKLKEVKNEYFETEIEPSSEIEDWIDYLDSNAKKWFNKESNSNLNLSFLLSSKSE